MESFLNYIFPIGSYRYIRNLLALGAFLISVYLGEFISFQFFRNSSCNFLLACEHLIFQNKYLI